MSENNTHNSAQWRVMHSSDLALVHAMSCIVHPEFPEDPDVFADRLAVFAEGARVLERDAQLLGYSFSHPWMKFSIPALNSLLKNIPEVADTYYLHDVALLPQARNLGGAKKLVELLVGSARSQGFDSVSLVAVNGSQPYWERQGFVIQDVPQLHQKLRTYSEDARYMMRDLQK